MSDFLFSRPSIISGIASTIDLFGVSSGVYNSSQSSGDADRRAFQADTKALANDWNAVCATIENDNE